MMSSFKLVPPVVTMTFIPMCLESSIAICDVCRASSRVGTTIMPEKMGKFHKYTFRGNMVHKHLVLQVVD